MLDPVGDSARTELDRLAHRWHTLPVGRARSAAVPMRALAAEWLGGPVEDLGPATALDQLRVAVYEAARAGTPDGTLGGRLADLRREVSETT
ncbi:hypothetical protein [Mobilicoccus pelagius]|uniref:Uncharacterized protein n=1 Tax=Mobilicoccus pelagius NBRC 104925 TaxID=1089455 RepID=H5USC2_9MICO|nr:hypothetical protein [Mobilicoccus pelagius]GAB48630.1 hypothetical protein MOPEL_078_00190 [Mobilicoccus pelagius NBRC 104925]